MPGMATLVLLDGHSLAYRAFYALPTDLATKAGTVTNAVFGFTSMLVKLLADEKPDYLAVAFDAPVRTFRYDLDPEYKAGRKETPDLFKSQMPLIREVLETMQVPQLCVEGVEADDVIATLATGAAAEGMDVIVVTGDRDAFQLIEDPHIKVLYNRRGVSDYVLYDEAGIAERYLGVTARQYPQYAALRGDNSDNLPGVPGIGEKTAAALIVKYGDLDTVFDHLDELPPKQRQNLGEHKERVLLNRTMTYLRRDLELEFAPGELRQGAWDPEAVRTLFNQLEFRSLFARLPMAMGEAAPPPETDALECVVDNLGEPEAAVRFLGEVATAGRRYILEPRFTAALGRSDLLGLAVATDDSSAAYLPADVLEAPSVVAALSALVGPGGPPLVAHRAKDLTHGLRRLPGGEAIDVRTLDLDTAVAAYLLDPAESTYELPDLARRYLQLDVAAGTAAAEGPGGGVSPQGSLDLDGTSGVEETGRRAVAVHRLAVALEEGLAARELTGLYQAVERPLVRVLARMEEAGVAVDLEFLRELSIELTKECGELEAKIHAAAGERFNVNSTPQLRTILFEKLGLTPIKKTKTGPSTDADSLQKMADKHPIVEDLLRYREVEKLRNTYADALPPLVGPDGRIHSVLNQTVAIHRADLGRGAESPEHPAADPGRPGVPPGLHPGRGVRAPGGGLLPDRAAAPGPPGPGPGADRGLPARRRRPLDHRLPGLRGPGGRGGPLPTALRQGGELRAGLRDGGLRAGPADGHPHRPGQGDPRRLLRLLPQRPVVHGDDGQGGQGPGLHHHADGPAPAPPGAGLRQLPDPPDGGADGPERSGPGWGGRHLQTGHGQPRRRAGGAGHAVPDGAHGPRRGGSGGAHRGAGCRRRVGARVMESVWALDVPLKVEIATGATWADAKE